MIDFEPTGEQQELAQTVAEFAASELADDVVRRDREGTFARDLWMKCARFGLQGLVVPPQYGGTGASAITTVLALEALGYGCRDNGLIFSLNAQIWACETPIVKFATDTQKSRYLERLCSGSLLAAHAMTEPDSGSDAFGLSTTAKPVDGGYVLDGSKTFVTNAPESGLFVVFATTNREHPLLGICAFLVERDTPGLVIGKPLSKMGLRTSPMSELFFDSCAVSEDQRLGAPGAGMAIFTSSMLWERSCILASTVGTMQRQLERVVVYARDRQQFGRSIGDFQAVSHRIVEMKMRLETCRLLLYRVAWLLDQGRQATLDSALVKLYLSEAFLQSSLDALQIHGGYGYMTEYELERDVRDAIAARIYSGTSDIQRNLIAHQLRLG